MWNKHRRKFLWSIAALGFLLWIAAYGAYSGSQTGVVAVPSFLADVKFTDVLLVVFSGLLYLATMATVEATRAMGKVSQRQEQHFRRSERAYVKMSHLSPPDVTGDMAFDLIRTPQAVVQIKNHGDTPATVVGGVLTYAFLRDGDSLPEVYDSPAAQRFTGAFLVKDDFYNITLLVPWTGDERAGLKSGALKLWVYGYVDYTDVFGQKHRAGYGRVRARGVRGNNLVYAPSPYNYDRPLDVVS